MRIGTKKEGGEKSGLYEKKSYKKKNKGGNAISDKKQDGKGAAGTQPGVRHGGGGGVGISPYRGEEPGKPWKRTVRHNYPKPGGGRKVKKKTRRKKIV